MCQALSWTLAWLPILTTTLWVGYYYLHFTDKETKAQRKILFIKLGECESELCEAVFSLTQRKPVYQIKPNKTKTWSFWELDQRCDSNALRFICRPCIFTNAMELIFSQETVLDFRIICQLERLRISKTNKFWFLLLSNPSLNVLLSFHILR